MLDREQYGDVEIAVLAQSFNAKSHPAVVEGRKTEEQILSEFLETFETHHNLASNGKPESRINLDEFLDYYHNVSASIEDDAYFQKIMESSWDVNQAQRNSNG